jgi:hypothetical protein
MKIFELLVDKLDEITGVDAVALVEQPAIEADFFAFKNENIEDVIEFNLLKLAVQEHFETGSYDSIVDDGKPLFDTIEEAEQSKDKFTFSISEDQQMVVGPLMIPNKLILRVDENNEPYYVYFSKETIKNVSEKVMREKYIDQLNLEHDSDKPVDGYMVSTWLVEDVKKDKQQVYGMDYPEGTWMGQYKIEDLSVWNKVKEGEIKGFSVEGFFGDRFVQAKKQN